MMRNKSLTMVLGLALSLCLVAAPAPAKKKEEKAPEPMVATPAKKTSLKEKLDAQTASKKVSVQAPPELVTQLSPEMAASLAKLSEAMKWEDRAVYQDLRDEEDIAVKDIGMLWQASVEHSGTIRYAIEKLSRRDATGEPVENDSFSKRLLQNVVRLGGAAGSMWSGSPAGMLGADAVQNIMSGNPQDSALSRVTDADMVLLAKEVDNLQSQMIEQYYAYRHAQQRMQVSKDAMNTIGKYYEHAMNLGGDDPTAQSLQPLMQSIYDQAVMVEHTAQQAVASTRSALVLTAGPDAVAALDESGSQANSPDAEQQASTGN